MTQRYSVGGQVVADSLAHVGTSSLPQYASLVETTRQIDLRVVMVQNAWNVVALETFVRLLKPYPWRWRFQAVARRIVTQINLKRAKKVVCLTEAVAEMARRTARGKVVVTPVAMPAHFSIPATVPSAPEPGTALVVGALTWYKRPLMALEVLARHHPEIHTVAFVGSGDETVWLTIERLARALGLGVTRLRVPHRDMPERYAGAAITVLPSALESLGFGVVEALAFGHRVLAADIPAHRDAARAFGGREPEWFTDRGDLVASDLVHRRQVTDAEVVAQWRQVAKEMMTC